MSAGDVDYLFPSDDFDTGGLSRDEVLGRGRNTDLIEDKTVALAEARVRKSGVLEMLDKWAAEDRGSDGLGGRPRMISSRAVLTALLLLARESSPMHVRRAALLLQVRLSPESQDLLGLPRTNSAFVARSSPRTAGTTTRCARSNG